MARRSGTKATRNRRGGGRSGQASPARLGQPQAAGAAAGDGRAASGGAPASGAAEPEALVASTWFDSGDGDEPYSATVRFSGQKLGADGRPGKDRDTFVQDEVVEGVVPGTGRVSVTAWVYGLTPGEWTVTAELIRATGGNRAAFLTRRPTFGSRALQAARWSWLRWSVETTPAHPLRTRWALIAPLARTPAVMPGIYTALAVVGGIVALLVQAAILSTEDVEVGSVLAVSLVAIVAGLLGAKAWYAVLHPDESIIRAGWAVDGFLVVTPLALALGLMAANLPIGRVLDATTPGLFLAVAVGRIGCFFTGCCAGRLTGARWGIWSSDRRVGARRVPTQLMESGTGLLLGLTSLPLAAGHVLPVHGAVFVVGFGIYAIARQALLRLRAERRSWSRSLPLTAGAALAVLAVVTVLSAVQIAGSPSFA